MQYVNHNILKAGEDMELRGAEIVLECLKKEEVDTIFGYPGGAVIPLYDALYGYREDFTHITTSHEQGAAHGADGYSRSTGKVGVCFTTSGPGATNIVTGIATAYADSIPLVIITGQVNLDLIGRDSFQEVDITTITLSVTKHNFLVRDVHDIARTIGEAFRIARSGRPGPVLVDIPKDLFTESTTYIPYIPPVDREENRHWTIEDIGEICKLIDNSQRPIIYSGGGVVSSNTSEELVKLVEKGNIPVVNTLMGLGGFPRTHPLSLGLVGMHGLKESNMAVQNSDLIVAIGARFSDRVIGRADEFGPEAKVVQIDIDKAEIGKNRPIDYSLVGHMKEILNELQKGISKRERTKWLEQIKMWKESMIHEELSWDGIKVLKSANSILDKDTIVVTDVGQHQMWTAQHWKFTKSRTFLTSGGLGTMGYGLGAAIGAKVGNPHRPVVLVTGDGSFRMNCNELSTVSKLNLPIIILIFNNSTLGMVRQWQGMFCNGRYMETDLGDEVDFIKLGEAYGIHGVKVSDVESLDRALKKAKSSDRATIIECILPKDHMVFPMVPAGMSINNMIYN